MDCKKLDQQIEKFEALFPIDNTADAKALVINLSSESSEEFAVPGSWIMSYSGGPALGVRLWANFAGPCVDDYSSYEADNPIVLVSPPSDSNLLTITFRSPQTGGLVSQLVAGEIAEKIRSFGYVAVILKDRLTRLGNVELIQNGVSYSFIEKMAGMGTNETAASVDGNSIVTGPAGENRIPFSICVCNGKSTGRGGLGFVFGSKNLKAFSVVSSSSETNTNISQKLVEKSKTSQKLLRTGSNLFVYNSIKDGWAPVCNFRLGTDPRLFHLCGDETKRRLGMEGVKSGCGYAETLMLGANVGCFDIKKVFERYLLCIEMGIDPVSTGCILGWLLEATEKKVFSLSDDFSFTDNHAVLRLIEGIGRKTGSLGILSKGIEVAAEEFGGKEFAYSINALECGPFDFRGNHTQALNSSLGNLFPVYPAFFSHICNSDAAGWTILNESLTLGFSSAGINPEILFCITGDLPLPVRFILRFIPKLKNIWFNPKRILKDTDRASIDIEGLGFRCSELMKIINSCIREQKPEYIPDYFMVDPQSNSKKTSIVPIHKLLREYETLRSRKLI